MAPAEDGGSLALSTTLPGVGHAFRRRATSVLPRSHQPPRMAAGGSSDNTEGPCLWARAANQAVLTQNRSILPFPSPSLALGPGCHTQLACFSSAGLQKYLDGGLEAHTGSAVQRNCKSSSSLSVFQEARGAAGSPAVGRCHLSTSVLQLLCRSAAGSHRGRDLRSLTFPLQSCVHRGGSCLLCTC